jgi:hypothetical protein
MASVTTRPPDGPDLARVAPETMALPLPSGPATVRASTKFGNAASSCEQILT